MSQLRWNLVANIIANVWSTLLVLALTPLYVAFLGVESYGLIGFYVSLTGILGILDAGISTTALQETAWLSARPEEQTQVRSLLRTLEVAYWGIMLLVGAVLLAGAWWLGAGWFRAATLQPDAVRTTLMLMVVSLVVQVPSGLYAGALMGLQRQVESSGLIALFATVRGIGAVAVVAAQPDIRAFFLWQIVAGAGQTAVLRWAVLRRAEPDAPQTDVAPRAWSNLRRYAGTVSLITALGIVITQADKVILSRLVPLESFGMYALAWTVASGLSRVTTPVLQAFSPRLTAAVAVKNDATLRRQVRLASQLTNALVLTPAVLLAFCSEAILLAWIGIPAVAAGAAPLLTVLVIGTMFSACSYPAISVLYSRRSLKPVVAVNLAAVLILLPALFVAVGSIGIIGAAFCWTAYGVATYGAYQRLGLRGLPDAGVLSSTLQDFVAPALVSLIVGAGTWLLATRADGRLELAGVIGLGLVAGWTASLVACSELLRSAVSTLRWKSIPTLWSA